MTCSKDLGCFVTSYDECVATCVADAKLGEDCSIIPCADGLACNDTERCESQSRTLGESCEDCYRCCGPGLGCDYKTDSCEYRWSRAPGQSCSEDFECEENLYCDRGTCTQQTVVGEGQRCGDGNRCSEGLFCWNSKCIVYDSSPYDDDCRVDDVCLGFGYCSKGKCEKLHEDGSTCTASEACASGVCADNEPQLFQCAAVEGEGSVCESYDCPSSWFDEERFTYIDADDPLTCVLGTCVRTKLFPKCRRAGDCESGEVCAVLPGSWDHKPRCFEARKLGEPCDPDDRDTCVDNAFCNNPEDRQPSYYDADPYVLGISIESGTPTELSECTPRAEKLGDACDSRCPPGLRCLGGVCAPACEWKAAEP